MSETPGSDQPELIQPIQIPPEEETTAQYSGPGKDGERDPLLIGDIGQQILEQAAAEQARRQAYDELNSASMALERLEQAGQQQGTDIPEWQHNLAVRRLEQAGQAYQKFQPPQEG